ncbi:MAG: hypothetical protein COA73_13560, partial [Candidatus Hydrogenedentota bacterium]
MTRLFKRIIPVISAILLLSVLSGCATYRSGDAAVYSPVTLAVAEPTLGTHFAVMPISRITPNKTGEWWEKRHNLLNERAAEGDHDLI